MTVDVRHNFISGKGDSPDASLVRPSNWNEAHKINMAGIALLGRSTADVGLVAEIPLGAGLSLTDGALAVTSSSIPVGTVVDFAGTSAPTKWLMCYGQALSRITYSDLFVIIGTTYGVGDGANTFNIPDLRGRVRAGKDNMGGTSADRLIAPLDGDTLGAVGGEEKHAFNNNEVPAHTHTGTTVASGSHRHFVVNTDATSASTPTIPAGTRLVQKNDTSGNSSYTLNASTRDPTTAETASAGNHSHTFTTDPMAVGVGVPILQPTIVINSIIYTGV